MPPADGGGLFSTTGGKPEAEGLGIGCNTGLLLLAMFEEDDESVEVEKVVLEAEDGWGLACPFGLPLARPAK